MTSDIDIPRPSDAVLLRLAEIAAHAHEMLSADQPARKAPAGITRIKNDRRRMMEAILVMLADPDVRGYIAELETLGLLPMEL